MRELFRYNKNALFIIISHDLSILTECDNILKIEKGKIMECSKTE
jgi:ABC-type bacteriocin/lantibiotic exporter with double-glycine peptidase domain